MKSSGWIDSGYVFKVKTMGFVHFAALANERTISVSWITDSWSSGLFKKYAVLGVL